MGCALHSRGSRPLSTPYGAPWLSVLSLLQLGSAVGQTTYCNVTLAMKIGDSGAGINFTLDSGCPPPPLSVSVRCTVFPTPTLPSRHGLRPVHCFTVTGLDGACSCHCHWQAALCKPLRR